MLVSRLFLKLLEYCLSRRSADTLKKKFNFLFNFQKWKKLKKIKRYKKSCKSQQPAEIMCLLGINLDVLTWILKYILLTFNKNTDLTNYGQKKVHN
jgi:hypothetical protein